MGSQVGTGPDHAPMVGASSLHDNGVEEESVYPGSQENEQEPPSERVQEAILPWAGGERAGQ